MRSELSRMYFQRNDSDSGRLMENRSQSGISPFAFSNERSGTEIYGENQIAGCANFRPGRRRKRAIFAVAILHHAEDLSSSLASRFDSLGERPRWQRSRWHRR